MRISYLHRYIFEKIGPNKTDVASIMNEKYCPDTWCQLPGKVSFHEHRLCFLLPATRGKWQWLCRARAHSRQVTGARCTEVAARQSWAEYSSRPTTDSRHQGWAIKDVFVLSEMLTICEQPLYDIVLMILHINKSCVIIRDQNSQIFLKST